LHRAAANSAVARGGKGSRLGAVVQKAGLLILLQNKSLLARLLQRPCFMNISLKTSTVAMRNLSAMFAILFCSASFIAKAAEVTEHPVPQIEVFFVHPEKFTDAGNDRSGYQSEQNLEQLKKFLIRRAATYFSPGQKLSISITDVDLAGGFEPLGRTMQEVRVMKGVYPPKIDLTFTLTDESGRVIKEGKLHLLDLGFNVVSRASSDTFVYDKAMLDDWLRNEFGSKQ
jgi:hypothetical protein